MSNVSINIKNVLLFVNNTFVRGGLHIEDGKIKKIAKDTKLPDAESVIDGNGNLLIPGGIDAHVHFRDPGFTYKEDFYTGSCAAAAGGITTVLDMPNNKPIIDTAQLLNKKKSIGEQKSIVDFSFHAGLPESLEELVKIKKTGVPSVKIYSYLLQDSISVLSRVFSFVKEHNLDLKFAIHAESREILIKNKRFIDDANLKKDLMYHALHHSPDAEVKEIEAILELVKKYVVPVHFCHVSTKEGSELILSAKREGFPVTFEYMPHHLLISHEKGYSMGPIAKVNPPLRGQQHVTKLQETISDVDIIASDHAPHTYEEKMKGMKDITKAPSGIVGVETLLPILLTLAHNGFLSYEEAIKKITTNPARVFSLPKGAIYEGADADLVLIDRKKEWIIRGRELHGMTLFTPFEGLKVRGKVLMTMVRGRIVYQNGEILEKPGWGRFVESASSIMVI
ncbi:MAG: dihydroorotase family protein [Candidatus Odinarchaeota archaeon]|nr:dihydroorotase family protein [Candidatus Odinarchaeota archaeon]